ncbi:hypothetical protein FSARC_2689 [Fusarium sarcochroum]|uniref:Enoyl reductase (ER) domain-containing protein n=1 Tax=Fusarium sarcochroum TaxID=1208366 RepID=A0A8H4U646_9HYPO|nr:hypothetical protein FSARC_2689 [Fusarium sarcochroum]
MANHMRAWRLDRSGSILQTLSLVNNVPRPGGGTLLPDQILVKVASAALNHADHRIPALPLARLMITMPKTPGVDLSGRVMSVAPNVTGVQTGDHVIARLDPMKAPGSLSEYVVINKGAWTPIAKDVNLDQAAGATTTALAAYQALKGRVSQGDKVFINGGSGGVGTFAIQIAKMFGCHVTVACSTSKIALCKDLGADEIIDYRTSSVTEHLIKTGQVFKLVIDNVANSPLNLPQACEQYLTPDGRYVYMNADMSLAFMKNLIRGTALPTFLGGYRRQFELFVTKDNVDDMAHIANWVAEKKIKTVVDKAFPFEATTEAYERLIQGSATGKIIVQIDKT